MEYRDISRVVEPHIDDVNKYLELGWVLLFVGQYSDTEQSHIYYSLGWDSKNGEPKEPPKPYSREIGKKL